MDLFGKRLKSVREMLNLKQDELALKIKQTGYQTISRYERGERYPNKSIMDLLASSLHVSEEYLITGFINQNLCYEISATININRLDVKELSIKLKVTEGFLRAIIDNEVSPSKEFFENVMQTVGVPAKLNMYNHVDEGRVRYSTGGENELQMLRMKVDELIEKQRDCSEALGDAHMEIRNLKSENAQLKIENEELKKELFKRK